MVALVGWFGPRGLASVVFALLALEELGSATADHAVAVITTLLCSASSCTVLRPIRWPSVMQGCSAVKQTDMPLPRYPAYRSADSSLLKAGMPCDLGSEVVAPLWLMVEPADEGLDVPG